MLERVLSGESEDALLAGGDEGVVVGLKDVLHQKDDLLNLGHHCIIVYG